MKKRTALLLVCLVVLTAMVGCSDDRAVSRSEGSIPPASIQTTITGSVEAVKTHTVSAPYSGLLLPFDLKDGQVVKKGDVLFHMDTIKVYAPHHGRIGSIKAAAGDDAQAVISVYGALCFIQPEHTMILNATTDKAYDRRENKYINIGERLYVRSKTDRRISAEGTVISIDGKSYTVEVNWDGFKLDEEVNLYRESNYTDESRVGAGNITRANPIAVKADGYVLACHVAENQVVKKGDLLFEMTAEKPDSNADGSQVVSQMDGILTNVFLNSGQQVQRGQALAVIAGDSEMHVVIDADEMDIEKLAVGDSVDIQMDSLPGTTYEGKVEYISSVGKQRQNATYYEVHISFKPGAKVMLGMSATVFLR